MRSAAVVTGVLGTGTVLVFALAGLVATLFPSGTLINATWNGGCLDCGWAKPGIGVPLPVPMPPGAEGGKVFVGGGTVNVSIDTAPVGPTGTDNDVVPQP